ncbi:hypothetical protein CASFOL_030441 [Castilleja foliolosa]|uniref:Replication protein A 70 kDa DNA-binding subunit B/D first OB fold domain-containing protein n=1 Tax=Castilleja foliolosa TaxID=1961234 RepID=A0ABD3C8L2_9LAMI
MATKGSSGPVTRPVKEIRRENKPAIKVRVVRRFYRGGNSSNKSLEIVFHDLEGGRITGVVKSYHLASLDAKIVQGRVYGIRKNNYYVENNTGKYLTTLHKFRIVLHGLTKLVEIPEESFFPDFMFDFRNFNTLANPDTIDETLLFDVIGKVIEIHNAQERDFHGKNARLIEMVLEDLSGIQVRCTLWDDYVDQVLAFEGNLGSGTPVIILQLCRAKVWNDKVYISNSFDTTQIHTLESIPAIELFKKLITTDNLDRSQSMSRGSLNSLRLEYDDLANGNMTVNPIETIFIVDEAVNFWVCAIVGSIIGNWSYLACTKCNKKLERVGLEYICDVCRKTYKLEFISTNSNSKFWIRLAMYLCSVGTGSPKNSSDVPVRSCVRNTKSLKADRTDLPMSLLKLVDQTVLFKVKVETKQLHKDNAVFVVSRLVTDPDVISKYTKYTAETESEADFLTLMLNEETNFETMSDDEVSTPIKKAFAAKTSLEREGGAVAAKSLDFDQECVGSTSAKSVRNITMTKKQYMRKFVVQDEGDDEDDDMVQVEEEENAEAKEKSG